MNFSTYRDVNILPVASSKLVFERLHPHHVAQFTKTSLYDSCRKTLLNLASTARPLYLITPRIYPIIFTQPSGHNKSRLTMSISGEGESAQYVRGSGLG